MNESDGVFLDRIDSTHIQRDEIWEFYQLVKQGKAISGISADELFKLVSDLESDIVEKSNDMVVEMIILSILNKIKDTKAKDILSKLKVGNISKDEVSLARAYKPYTDDSCYIEINSKILIKIQHLSDVFAVFFMRNENIDGIGKSLIEKILQATVQRYLSCDGFVDEYTLIQLKMMLYDIYSGTPLTDNFVAYSREIEEVAVATLLGHEVGHYYLGHANNKGQSEDELKKRELDADKYGVDFAFDYFMGSYPSGEKRFGLHLFAGVIVPVIASSFFEDILKEGKEHPSIYLRYLGVMHKLKQLIDTESMQEVNNYINDLCKNINIHFE